MDRSEAARALVRDEGRLRRAEQAHQERLFDVETSSPHCFDQILPCCTRANDDVDQGLEPRTAHSDRLRNAGLTVDDEFLRHAVNDVPARRQRKSDFAGPVSYIRHAQPISVSDAPPESP